MPTASFLVTSWTSAGRAASSWAHEKPTQAPSLPWSSHVWHSHPAERSARCLSVSRSLIAYRRLRGSNWGTASSLRSVVARPPLSLIFLATFVFEDIGSGYAGTRSVGGG